MDIKDLFINVIHDYVENGGIINTNKADSFDENYEIEYYFGKWAQPIKGHLEADSEYFYIYDDSFSYLDADMIINDDGKKIYVFLIRKH